MASNEDDAASVASLAASHDSVNSAKPKKKTRKSVRSKLERVRKGAEEPAKGYNNGDLERVRANWQCKLKDCLPVALVPRPLIKNGTRTGINEADKTRLRPQQWSKRLTQALATLSLHTAGDRSATIDMLSAEVARRQKRHNHKEWYAREVLVSDIIAVNADIYRQKQQGSYKTQTNEWRRLEIDDTTPDKPDLAGIGQVAPEGHAVHEWMRTQYAEKAGLRERG